MKTKEYFLMNALKAVGFLIFKDAVKESGRIGGWNLPAFQRVIYRAMDDW